MTTPNSKALRRRLALLLVGLALLCGCAGEQQGESGTPAPASPELPAQAESAPALPLTGVTPEELLARQPVDEDHDAFLVDTGGRMGTLLVTVEREEGAGQEWADLLQFSVWDPAHMDTPIQRMEMETNVFHRSRIVDANFDGYMDFGYMYAMGNQPCYSHFWLWDENQEQFVEEPLLAEISCPEFDQETGIIDGYARDGFAGLAGRQTFHRWIDGALICIRKVQTYPEDGSAEHFTLTVEETVNGTLTEVFRKTTDAGNILDEALKWHDLAYHGEP